MIDGIVFQIQLAYAELLREAIGFDERRIPGVVAGPRLSIDGQQLAVSPEVPCARLDFRATHVLPDLVVVVDDFERSQALVADPQCLCREHRLAQVTLQSFYVLHIPSRSKGIGTANGRLATCETAARSFRQARRPAPTPGRPPASSRTATRLCRGRGAATRRQC